MLASARSHSRLRLGAFTLTLVNLEQCDWSQPRHGAVLAPIQSPNGDTALERFQVERLRVAVAPLQEKQVRQVVQCQQSVRMVVAKDAAALGERFGIEFLGGDVAPLQKLDAGQIVQRFQRFGVVATELCAASLSMCGRTRVEVASQGRSAAARRSGPRRHARGGLLAGGAAASAAARVGRGSRRPLWSTYPLRLRFDMSLHRLCGLVRSVLGRGSLAGGRRSGVYPVGAFVAPAESLGGERIDLAGGGQHTVLNQELAVVAR